METEAIRGTRITNWSRGLLSDRLLLADIIRLKGYHLAAPGVN